MDDPNRKLPKALFILAISIGGLLSLFWDAKDQVGESEPVLGRTYDEVMKSPQGMDKELSPTKEHGRAKKRDSHDKAK